ncbi:HalOD1 output domain-containing protein [Halorussus halobius]|uniref:HalOD1 output domain-containing protein n=1 Tax=Halorussus halobius TaxID=1710537 RepID=UPI001091A76E|nr:HalOD1 output domain-containing protein [Halorussus halobius]
MNDTDSPASPAADGPTYASNTAHAHFDAETDERPVPAVLEALGEAAERPVDELGVRLHDAVDPDALDDLFRTTATGLRRDEGHVSFAVGEFSVDVHADGHVFARRTR